MSTTAPPNGRRVESDERTLRCGANNGGARLWLGCVLIMEPNGFLTLEVQVNLKVKRVLLIMEGE
jgi:hypothetical protein